ncbi:discoidin domain-containing protein [Pseudoflavitalea rhizosphaerae]|uniref:discoidin domain-containing protein n=1 Tax=Pseudoflavitalea rhizosphaerae TaxID=1884793 RepID=UPI0013DF8E2D|nr:discoidin domain-containing protein [Pseudoflavitalea rhizosphaerae]
MKSAKIYSIVLACFCAMTACNKPEAVLFNDKSTAAKADKSEWTATADSETPDGWENTGKASATIDGNIATYWHTDYSVVVPYPHWVLIDMKSSLHIVSVDITNRQAATPNKVGMKKFRIEGSGDGTNFSSLGEFQFAITNDAQPFPVSSANGYRYLKITALEPQVAGTNHTFLGEIDVYTTK